MKVAVPKGVAGGTGGVYIDTRVTSGRRYIVSAWIYDSAADATEATTSAMVAVAAGGRRSHVQLQLWDLTEGSAVQV